MKSLYIFILSFILPRFIKSLPLTQFQSQSQHQSDDRKIIIILLSSNKTLEQFEGELTHLEHSNSTVSVTLNFNSSSILSPPPALLPSNFILLVILNPKKAEKYETSQPEPKERTVEISHWKNILRDGEVKRWGMIPENLKNDVMELIKKFQQGQVEATSNVLRPSQYQEPTAEVETLTEYAEKFLEALNDMINGNGPLAIKLPFDYLVQLFKDLNLPSLDFGAKDKIYQKLLELLDFGNPPPEEKKEEDNTNKKHSFITIAGNGNSNGNGFSAGRPPSSNPSNSNPLILPVTPKPKPTSLSTLLLSPSTMKPLPLSLSPTTRPIIKPLFKPTLAPKPVHLLIPMTNNKPLNNNNNNNNYSPHQQQQQNNGNSNQVSSSSSSGSSSLSEADKYISFPFTTMASTIMPNWNFDEDEINFYPDKNNNNDASNSNGNPGSGGGIFNLNFNLIKLNLNFNFQYQQPTATPPFLALPFVAKPSKRPMSNSPPDDQSNDNGSNYDT